MQDNLILSEKEKIIISEIRKLENGRITIIVQNNNIIRQITETNLKFEKIANSKL